MSSHESDALFQFGRLYRNTAGQEVWIIRDANGNTIADNIASDYDAAFIAGQI